MDHRDPGDGALTVLLRRFHHVGVVVESAAAAVEFYRGQGYQVGTTVNDPIQRADIVLLTRDDGPMLELVAPATPESPAAGWLKRIKAGAYHTCYEVADIARARSDLAAAGFVSVLDPVPAVAFNHRLVSFLWSKHTGLVEILAET